MTIKNIFHFTFDELMDFIEDDELYEDIDSSEYTSGVMHFWDIVESKYKDWLERLADRLCTDTGTVLLFVMLNRKCNEYMSGKKWLMRMYLSHYDEEAYEAWPDAYEWSDDPEYHCKVCHRDIEYSSLDSVMLTNQKWDEVLDFYGLHEYEEQAHKNSMKLYDIYERRGGLRMNQPDNCHLFICNECMEKALGHKLEPDDLNVSPFNVPYREEYFEK